MQDRGGNDGSWAFFVNKGDGVLEGGDLFGVDEPSEGDSDGATAAPCTVNPYRGGRRLEALKVLKGEDGLADVAGGRGEHVEEWHCLVVGGLDL